MGIKIEKTSLETKTINTISVKQMISGILKHNIRQYTMVIALLSIWILFTILTKGTFITSRNLSNLFLQTVTIAILAVGMVLVMVAGHIDLSVGSVAGFLGAIAGFLQVKMNFGTIPAVLVTLAVGLIIGIWQGYWIAYRGVPAFIVTLAGMLVFKGGMIGVTQGAALGPMNDSFKAIGQGYLPRLLFKDAPFHDTSVVLAVIVIILFIVFDLKRRQSRIKYGFEVLPMNLQFLKMLTVSIAIGLVFSIMITYMGVPYAILLLMVLALLFSFITSKTTFGRHVYAIGGNKEAARLSGINIKQRTMTIFILMGVLSAIASIVFTGRLNSATPGAGNLFELDAIAASVIGGTSTMGGEGTVFGAIIGALVMASVDNGMSLMNLDVTYQYVVKGLILLIAVWVDIATRKKGATT
ncbi:MAG: D-xylose transport system permease protein [Petroclostridium sp.]|jgi:D-xylose transport system permease protein|uniref:sugar ABC transporter permease n=1 Tax=Petroclostridium xylanilyticum TaxID=1792311 RepID=UPI0018E37044|nr:sugar ABC transporter permease [Petroclostridium xylanilyticum]MBZ4646901.1 ABC-type transporter, integral rane subunit [Clostridia bacterium]MDK2811109.1 D-xylose transport system permease protein [Petroclostridium sp.]